MTLINVFVNCFVAEYMTIKYSAKSVCTGFEQHIKCKFSTSSI